MEDKDRIVGGVVISLLKNMAERNHRSLKVNTNNGRDRFIVQDNQYWVYGGIYQEYTKVIIKKRYFIFWWTTFKGDIIIDPSIQYRISDQVKPIVELTEAREKERKTRKLFKGLGNEIIKEAEELTLGTNADGVVEFHKKESA